LELHDSAGMIIASNDDWTQAANAQSIPINLHHLTTTKRRFSLI
jgi:hypothetical protein